MAFLVDKAFLVATQECFENAIATGILRLGSTHPDLDKFSGSAFLEKKSCGSEQTRDYAFAFHLRPPV